MTKACDFCKKPIPASWWAFIEGKPAYACSRTHKATLMRDNDYQTGIFPVAKLKEEKP